VGHVHLRWVNPMPRDLGRVLRRFRTVIVPEMNMGQLVRMIRDHLLIDAIPINKIKGQPFTAAELTDQIRDILTGRHGAEPAKEQHK